MSEKLNSYINSIFSDCGELFVSPQNPKYGDELSIRIRMFEENKIEKVILLVIINGEQVRVDMELDTVQNEKTFIYYKALLKVREPVIAYKFILVEAERFYYYTQKGLSFTTPLNDNDFKILTDFAVPEWVSDSVFYQIFPERFCSSDKTKKVEGLKQWNEATDEINSSYEYYGGDLYGIIEKLDYIRSIGFNAIYLNPIFTATSSHKYDCEDYFSVDSHFGGNKALQELVENCHRKGIKLMLDISINHTGHKHYWVTENPDFYFAKEDGTFEGWNGIKTLLSLNYNKDELRNKMYKNEDSALKKWLFAPYEVDAWRFDVGQSTGRMNDTQLDKVLWPEIRNELKALSNPPYIIGEHFGDGTPYLQGNMWDASMNYLGFTRPMRKFLGDSDIGLAYICRDLKAVNRNGEIFRDEVLTYMAAIPSQIRNVAYNLIDSHDISRFNDYNGYDRKSQLSAILFLFTFPGIPSIYYGDEIGIKSRKLNDSSQRFPMQWNSEKWDLELKTLYTKMIAFRKSENVLKYGAFKFLECDELTVSYARFDEGCCVILVSSQSERESFVRVDLHTLGCYGNFQTISAVGDIDYSTSENYLIFKFDRAGTIVLKAYRY